jgi:hypothetical protein
MTSAIAGIMLSSPTDFRARRADARPKLRSCILGTQPRGCCIQLLSALGHSDALQLMRLIMDFELLPDFGEVKDNARRDIAVFKPVKDLIDRR